MHSYDPFGMMMPHPENTDAGGHSFGFQGQEMDNELKGTGNSYNFSYRMHDPRVGRFLKMDADSMLRKYPGHSPYSFSHNRVIDKAEIEGLQPGERSFRAGLELQNSDAAELERKARQSSNPLVDWVGEKIDQAWRSVAEPFENPSKGKPAPEADETENVPSGKNPYHNDPSVDPGNVKPGKKSMDRSRGKNEEGKSEESLDQGDTFNIETGHYLPPLDTDAAEVDTNEGSGYKHIDKDPEEGKPTMDGNEARERISEGEND